ncbi:hypothetical protein NWT09_13190 [Mycolicibacterium sp. jd]|uniref:hypothetical protein n=1 Tax=unclassified Mycolicibacterium TaxID=2636767 RepID=UPI00351B4E07
MTAAVSLRIHAVEALHVLECAIDDADDVELMAIVSRVTTALLRAVLAEQAARLGLLSSVTCHCCHDGRTEVICLTS